jgi:hypothetical protein
VASFLRPVGPLPPSVYWRRRAVLLGIPLVLIIAVAYSCSGSSPKQPARTSATPPSGTPSTGSGVIEPSVMPTGTAGPGNYYPPVGPTQSGGGGSTPSPGSGSTTGAGNGSGSNGGGGSSGSLGAGCALSLTLTLDRGAGNGSATYPAGQDPDFVVSARNSGGGNCLLDVSGKGIVITVSNPAANNALVWTSSTCPGTADSRALGPGDTYQATTVWQRIRSEASCPQNPTSAGTGTFVVTVTAGGATAASVQFILQ